MAVDLLLLLVPAEGGGEAAGKDHTQHGDHGQDGPHTGEDHQDDGDLSVQTFLYDEQTACNYQIEI